MLLTAYDLLEQRGHRRALRYSEARRARVLTLDGYAHRDLGVIVTLGAGQSTEVFFAPRAPAYLLAVAAKEAAAEGFEYLISSDGEGRLSTVPLRSFVSDAGTMSGVTLTSRTLSVPRYFSGALRVQIRNLAAVQQECAVVLSIAEPLAAESVSAEVRAEQTLLSTMLPFDSPVGVSVRGSGPVARSFSGFGGDARIPDLQTMPIQFNVSVLDNIAVLLQPQPVATQIHSLQLFLAGSYTDPLSMQLFAESGSGQRPLTGRYTDISPGGNLSFQLSVIPYWTIEPGERLMVSSLTFGAGLGVVAGLMHFRSL